MFEYLKENLSELDIKSIEKIFLNNCGIFWILHFLTKATFFMSFEFHWKSWAYFLILQWNDNTSLFFIQFIFFLLTFVKVSIQSLIRSYHGDKLIISADVVKLESKFLQLHDIMMNLNEIFGFLLSLVIFYITFLVTMRVSYELNENI